MFTKKKSENAGLDEAIDHLLSELQSYDLDSEEKSHLLKQLAGLYQIRENTRRRVSPDTLLIVGGNIAGILIIVLHERANVVTSKAVNFVMKLR